jgi:hypothetical protein
MDSDNASLGAKLEQDHGKLEVGSGLCPAIIGHPNNLQIKVEHGSNLFNERAVFVPQNMGPWQVNIVFR